MYDCLGTSQEPRRCSHNCHWRPAKSWSYARYRRHQRRSIFRVGRRSNPHPNCLLVRHSFCPPSLLTKSLSLGSPEQQREWNSTDLGKTAFAEQMFRRSAYSGGRPAGGINLRDNLRRNDASQTPLEFIYEAADCRMWYTAPMINDVTMVWKGVADRMFRNGTQMCVERSTGHLSSVTGGGQAKGGERPPPPVSQGGLANAASWQIPEAWSWSTIAITILLMLC